MSICSLQRDIQIVSLKQRRHLLAGNKLLAGKFFHPLGAKPGICAVKVIYKVVRNFKRLPAIPRVPVFPPLIPAVSVCVCVFVFGCFFICCHQRCVRWPPTPPSCSSSSFLPSANDPGTPNKGPLKQNGHLSCPLISQPSPLESILTFHSALIEGNGAFRGCYR